MLLTVFACLLGMNGTAEACKCMPPDLTSSYNQAEAVVHVRILPGAFNRGNDRYYDAVLIEDAYKGCLTKRTRVLIRTARSSAACGVTLRTGTEYLISARLAGRSLGRSVLQTGSCDSNPEWRALSSDNLAFLHSRYNCCGDRCACADGTQPVQCFVNPCDVSSCDVEGAECQANYCGGCNAEWSDENGARVCENQCDYTDPTRRYVAQSRSQCALVRFACGANEQPFFDDCGCGCESLECEPSECGPALGMPNTLCADGTTVAGPTGRCLRDENGGCGWEVQQCPTACASSQSCASGSYCTTEDGVCLSPPGCGPGKFCPAVCYGWCAPQASI